jgi:DNA-binding response OmpR family regulator
MSEQSDDERGSVLAVGLPESELNDSAVACTTADTARSAIELLRMLRFDLVITADQLPDMPVWQFVQRMKSAWPWQKWAMVSSRLNERDEITARTLGVMQIIQGDIDWDAVAHLADKLREQSTQKVRLRSEVKLLRTAESTG